uniref:Si:dkeyp-2c8.3 n=1 Tax=Iconisemion striatum TaxID=60296 RepID=A0A1A7W621_9TELE
MAVSGAKSVLHVPMTTEEEKANGAQSSRHTHVLRSQLASGQTTHNLHLGLKLFCLSKGDIEPVQKRKEIVENEPLVAEVKERWPDLFKEQQIEAEFARLTSVDLKKSFFSGLDRHLPRFLELFMAKSGKSAGLSRHLKCLDDDSSILRKRSVVLLGLPYFLKEDSSSAFKTVLATDDEATFTRGMKVGVLLVKDGEDIIATSVVLEEQVVLPDVEDIPLAIALLMGLLFALNIDYPKELRYTFEVFQKVLMNIGGGQCSSLVHGLRNRLLRKTM